MSITRIEDIKNESKPTIELRRSEDGQLILKKGKQETPVELRRCFPWSEPSRYFSLRDEDENEMALIESMDRLDPASREVLEQAAAERGFVFIITAIDQIEEEFEIRVWKVMTKQGPRQFQTARDEWPHDVPGGGLLIRDVAGDLFHIPDPDGLDEASQTRLWAFID